MRSPHHPELERLDSLVDIGSYRCRVDGTILQMDDTARRIFGLTGGNPETDPTGRRLQDFLQVETDLPEDWLSDSGHLARELVFRTRDGLRRWVLQNIEQSETFSGTECWVLVHDVSLLRETQQSLRRHETILYAVGEAASSLFRHERWESGVQSALECLGKATGVSRIYVFANHTRDDGVLAINQRYEWVAPGIEPQIDNPDLQDAGYGQTGFGRWEALLGSGEAVYGATTDFPSAERELLELQNIKSVAVVPIFSRRAWWGFIGFDDCENSRFWTVAEIDALRAAAGMLGAAIDRRRSERELAQRNRQMEQVQRLEAVGRFSAGIAHDFNNLLTVLSGYADEIRPEKPPEINDTYVRGIHDTIVRASDLTQRLLSFGRGQRNDRRTIAVNRVLQGLEPMLKRLLPRTIELSVQPGKNSGWVRMDPGQIDQILINLVLNARDFMPVGGSILMESGAREVSDQEAREQGVRPGQYSVILVQDQGTGMDAVTKTHVFDPFYSQRDGSEGTGLGLSVSYGLVKQYGGFMTVESAPGEGSAFYVHLPQASPPESAARPDAEDRVGERGTVLVVEDEEVLRDLFTQGLMEAGFRVFAAADGKKALEFLSNQASPVDLLITDIAMPNLSGTDLALQVRTTMAELPILFVSGDGSDPAALPLGDGRLTALLQKPFRTSVLIKRAIELVERGRREAT